MVYISAQNPKTFGKDIEDMTKESLTFYQVTQTAHFNLIAKQRLKMFKDSIFNYLPIILGE
jgi:hypothetical protein